MTCYGFCLSPNCQSGAEMGSKLLRKYFFLHLTKSDSVRDGKKGNGEKNEIGKNNIPAI